MTAYGIKPLSYNHDALADGTQNDHRDVTKDLFGGPVNTAESTRPFEITRMFKEILGSDRLFLECAMTAASEMDECKKGGLQVTQDSGVLKVEGKYQDVFYLALNLGLLRAAVVNAIGEQVLNKERCVSLEFSDGQFDAALIDIESQEVLETGGIIAATGDLFDKFGWNLVEKTLERMGLQKSGRVIRINPQPSTATKIELRNAGFALEAMKQSVKQPA